MCYSGIQRAEFLCNKQRQILDDEYYSAFQQSKAATLVEHVGNEFPGICTDRRCKNLPCLGADFMCNKSVDGRTEVRVEMWIVQFFRFYLPTDFLGTHYAV
jgi:hypothetical protein